VLQNVENLYGHCPTFGVVALASPADGVPFPTVSLNPTNSCSSSFSSAPERRKPGWPKSPIWSRCPGKSSGRCAASDLQSQPDCGNDFRCSSSGYSKQHFHRSSSVCRTKSNRTIDCRASKSAQRCCCLGQPPGELPTRSGTERNRLPSGASGERSGASGERSGTSSRNDRIPSDSSGVSSDGRPIGNALGRLLGHWSFASPSFS
jgi:hypothetical protein